MIPAVGVLYIVNVMATTKDEIRARIASSVRAERARHGLTQYELANRTGLNRSYISEIEGGDRMPSAWVVVRLAEALETTVGKLLGEG